MARPLRVNLAGGWYHVMARGIEGRWLWSDHRDRGHFFRLLAEWPERFRIRLHAFALMHTHYHLQVETLQPNLSQAMHWLNQAYSTWFNVKHHRVGHLFAGRFKAIVTEPGGWAGEVNRYIHLNPVRTKALGLDKESQARSRAGLSAAPDPALVRRRVEQLRAYRWSSYRAYLGLQAAPVWLTCDVIRTQVGGEKPGVAQRRYREWVEGLLREGLEEEPWERAAAGLLLGSAEFVERMKSGLTGNAREQPQLKLTRPVTAWPAIQQAVVGIKGEPWEAFRDRHGDWGRDLALHLARRWSGLTLRQLGALGGGLDYVAVSMALRRFAQRLRRDAALRRAKRRVEQLLNVKT